MVKKIDTALINLWGNTVGAVSWLDDKACAVFEYAPKFLQQALDISPLMMSIDEAKQNNAKFSFPQLNKITFLGLPGMLADALPDKFGNQIINTWLAKQGRDAASFNPIERLCYIGTRGMGALEFHPAFNHSFQKPVPIEIPELVTLAQTIMKERAAFNTQIGSCEKENTDAIKVATLCKRSRH